MLRRSERQVEAAVLLMIEQSRFQQVQSMFLCLSVRMKPCHALT